MSVIQVDPKDPDAVESFHFVFCDKDGTNTNSATNTGRLQGATINTRTVTVPDGITKDSDNQNAVTINGVTYLANTVVTVWLSGGIDGTDYDILCRIVTSDGRTIDQTMRVPVRSG